MNERITLLALKASDPKTGWLDRQKFAELIVKECCETVERRYKYSNGTPVSFWQMSQDVQDLLKEHFGVEE